MQPCFPFSSLSFQPSRDLLQIAARSKVCMFSIEPIVYVAVHFTWVSVLGKHSIRVLSFPPLRVKLDDADPRTSSSTALRLASFFLSYLSTSSEIA